MIGTLKIIETYGEGVFEFSDSFINVVIPFNKEVLKNRDNINGDINGDINNKLSERVGSNKTGYWKVFK